IAERPGRIGERQLRAVRRHVSEAGVEERALPGVPEDAGTAAEAGLAVTEQIVGKAQARREILIGGLHSALRDAGVAAEEQPRRGVGKLLRRLAGIIVLLAELLDPSVHVAPGEVRLPAQTHVEGEAAAGPEVILNVEADRLIADILGFAGSLPVGAQLSQKEAGQGVVGGVGSETVSTELVK